jgi:hypothetical protein
MSSTTEGLSIQNQEATNAGADLSPAIIGAQILLELGVGYDVSGIRVIGPNPECRGTIADMVGMPSHSAMKERIIQVAVNAKDVGEDPSKAVSDAIDIFAARDENGQVIRVPEVQLKKN